MATPQSAQSAMSLDNSIEKQQKNENIQNLSKNNLFQPQLNFEFDSLKINPSKTNEKSKIDDEFSFSIGISNNSKKKKEKIISPGKKKKPDFVNINTLRKSFDSIHIDNDIKNQFGVRQPASARVAENDRSEKDFVFLGGDKKDTKSDYIQRFADKVGGYTFGKSNINAEANSTFEFDQGILFPDEKNDSDDEDDREAAPPSVDHWKKDIYKNVSSAAKSLAPPHTGTFGGNRECNNSRFGGGDSDQSKFNDDDISEEFRAQSLFNEPDPNINVSESKNMFRFSDDSENSKNTYTFIPSSNSGPSFMDTKPHQFPETTFSFNSSPHTTPSKAKPPSPKKKSGYYMCK
jgi:hypothetical protein